MLRFIIDADHPLGYSLPSYHVQDAYIASSTYTRMWVVAVDAPSTSSDPHTSTIDDSGRAGGGNDLPQKRFILYKALSLTRADVLRGRATRIWLAWISEDMGKEQKDRKVCRFISYLSSLVDRSLVGSCPQRRVERRAA